MPGIVGRRGLFNVLPPLMAADRVPQVFRQDGLHPLHGDGQFAAVDDVAADQDGAALDGEFEVLHFDSRIFLELLVPRVFPRRE